MPTLIQTFSCRQIDICEDGLTKNCRAKVRPAEVCLSEDRMAEVRRVEFRAAEVRPIESRL